MHRSRAPSIAPGTFFVAQSWAGCITNMPGFNLRQAQGDLGRLSSAGAVLSGRADELRLRHADYDQHDTLPGPSRDLRAARAGNQGQDADGRSRGHQRRRAAGRLIVPPAGAPSGQGAAAGSVQSHEDAGAALTLAAVHESTPDPSETLAALNGRSRCGFPPYQSTALNR